MPVKKNPTPRELEVEFCDLKLQPVEIMTNKNTEIISIEPKILTIRGVKVMLDSDLAALHGVITGRLNEAVKRNLMCFPEEFMFVGAKTDIEQAIGNAVPVKMAEYIGRAILNYMQQYD